MRFRTMLAIALSVALAAFLILNWRVFAARVTLSFLVSSLDAPIGIVMLVLFALGVLVLSSYLGAWQGTLLMEFRRQTKELQAQRTLAESAEASRFTELGTLVREEMANSSRRVEAALEGLRGELHAAENSLAATLAEMDDRYRRALERPAG
ncbi:MAG: LapA family protein [Steroidobacteraceae bacterium]|jgi:uncharacterized integral membrane protein